MTRPEFQVGQLVRGNTTGTKYRLIDFRDCGLIRASYDVDKECSVGPTNITPLTPVLLPGDRVVSGLLWATVIDLPSPEGLVKIEYDDGMQGLWKVEAAERIDFKVGDEVIHRPSQRRARVTNLIDNEIWITDKGGTFATAASALRKETPVPTPIVDWTKAVRIKNEHDRSVTVLSTDISHSGQRVVLLEVGPDKVLVMRTKDNRPVGNDGCNLVFENVPETKTIYIRLSAVVPNGAISLSRYVPGGSGVNAIAVDLEDGFIKDIRLERASKVPIRRLNFLDGVEDI